MCITEYKVNILFCTNRTTLKWLVFANFPVRLLIYELIGILFNFPTVSVQAPVAAFEIASLKQARNIHLPFFDQWRLVEVNYLPFKIFIKNILLNKSSGYIKLVYFQMYTGWLEENVLESLSSTTSMLKGDIFLLYHQLSYIILLVSVTLANTI